jgi:hypothetical protein
VPVGVKSDSGTKTQHLKRESFLLLNFFFLINCLKRSYFIYFSKNPGNRFYMKLFIPTSLVINYDSKTESV